MGENEDVCKMERHCTIMSPLDVYMRRIISFHGTKHEISGNNSNKSKNHECDKIATKKEREKN